MGDYLGEVMEQRLHHRHIQVLVFGNLESAFGGNHVQECSRPGP
jgi:hypothetical protein